MGDEKCRGQAGPANGGKEVHVRSEQSIAAEGGKEDKTGQEDGDGPGCFGSGKGSVEANTTSVWPPVLPASSACYDLL